jgi:hypothetical protein
MSKASSLHSTQVGPHDYERIIGGGWRRHWEDRCRACYLPKSEHPVKGWVEARPLGDRSPVRPRSGEGNT